MAAPDVAEPDDPFGGDDAVDPCVIGWALNQRRGGVVYLPPERLSTKGSARHAKSAARCPAVRNMESRYVVIRSPFDLHIGFTRADDGSAALMNRRGERSPIRTTHLDQALSLSPEAEWQFPERPVLQLSLPYVFVADEPVYVTVSAPFAHYRSDPLPGTTFGGRFPIDVWPRPVVWAFEWHDPERDLVIERGEPLFYCHFECENPSRRLELVEAEYTTELEHYVDHIASAVNYVDNTFSLFDDAARVRPAKLVTPKPVGRYRPDQAGDSSVSKS